MKVLSILIVLFLTAATFSKGDNLGFLRKEIQEIKMIENSVISNQTPNWGIPIILYQASCTLDLGFRGYNINYLFVAIDYSDFQGFKAA